MDNPGPHSFPADADGPAVNHAGGIARLMGDGALFGRVLARFRNEYRQAVDGIRAALAAGDSATALRLAHTLKGAAGMIEAVPLRRAAQALEQLLRSSADVPEHAVTRLQDELDRVLRELDVIAHSLPERPAATFAPTPAHDGAAHDGAAHDGAAHDGAAHDGALERLITLLDDGNGDAVDLVHDAAGTLAPQLGNAVYGQVAALIDAFDFDGALALLRHR